MKPAEGGSFDPETIALLTAALEGAWDHLSAEQQATTSRSILAQRICKLAADGERDPIRLRAYALMHVVAPTSSVA
ncbi:MAG: hypothetical protein ACREVC_15280 [Burkholderiales bacterium]